MSGYGRCIFILSVVIAGFAAPAWAQDGPQNLDAGKSAPQLFASDCAICHKSPQGLARSGGMLGLDGFLREHYTASKESAAMLSAYLKSVGGEAPAPLRAKAKQPPKGDAKKPAAAKPDEKKSTEDAKPASAQPAEAKPAENKPPEVKPSEPKPAESKPADAKPSDAKPE